MPPGTSTRLPAPPAGPCGGRCWRPSGGPPRQEGTQWLRGPPRAAPRSAPGRPAPPGGGPLRAARGAPGERNLRQLLRRAVAARRALADTDEALSRLASGRYGLCEGCAAAIPAWLLTAAPDARFCPRCQPPSLPAAKDAVWSTT